MAVNELNPEASEVSEVPEVKERDKDIETVDADFESELDGKYDEYLSGKSKEELLQMRSDAISYQKEELVKLRDELMKMKESDSDDSDPERVLKLTRHR